MDGRCPFCEIAPENIWFQNETGVVLWDGFPVSQGHSLVVPHQHVASLFDLEPELQSKLWRLVTETRERLQEKFQPDGYNIGLNDGVAAGQTVMHAHIHVIPRWENDVPDPRGGVRWIIPDKANYWGNE